MNDAIDEVIASETVGEGQVFDDHKRPKAVVAEAVLEITTRFTAIFWNSYNRKLIFMKINEIKRKRKDL